MEQIIVQNLGKKYKRYASQWYRLAEVLSWGYYQNHENRWALKDINFAVNQGEAVGIIGVNGAGKSTFLKLLVGTTQPNEGSVQSSGRVGALLELGMGFHPDFTGRENAAMSCRMAGLGNDEIKDLMSDIQHFSELGDYLDQPLRVYSTGMQMRLAFSAATVVRPEILIVDEALSVGDAYFQHKCIKRIRSFQEKDTTLLFVSHDAGAVKALCKRALLFDKGRLIIDGEPDTVLDYYNALIAKKNKDEEIKQVENNLGTTVTRSGTGEATIRNVELFNEQSESTRVFKVGDSAIINCLIQINKAVNNPTVGFLIRDRLGTDVFGTNTHNLRLHKHSYKPGETINVQFNLPISLGCGNYSLSVAVHAGDAHLERNYDWLDQCLVFEVIPARSSSFVGLAFLPVKAKIEKVD